MNLSNNYRYSKCVDCVHAHMNKDGNHDCGFLDCVSEEDREYPDEKIFESYMSCYDCFQRMVRAERDLEDAEGILNTVS